MPAFVDDITVQTREWMGVIFNRNVELVKPVSHAQGRHHMATWLYISAHLHAVRVPRYYTPHGRGWYMVLTPRRCLCKHPGTKILLYHRCVGTVYIPNTCTLSISCQLANQKAGYKNYELFIDTDYSKCIYSWIECPLNWGVFWHTVGLFGHKLNVHLHYPDNSRFLAVV